MDLDVYIRTPSSPLIGCGQLESDDLLDPIPPLSRKSRLSLLYALPVESCLRYCSSSTEYDILALLLNYLVCRSNLV